MATTNELGTCSKVRLTLHVPRGRTYHMRKLLKPVLRHADPSLSLLHINESEPPVLKTEFKPSDDVPKYSVNNEDLSTPCLGLMVFLPEDGTLEESRACVQGFPWKFHHRIELQKTDSPKFVAGTQEFYSLSRQYPLCSLCPSPTSSVCTVRFNLFVRNFRAMLEFYRLLADSEMESNKADFALFAVNTSDVKFTSAASSYVSSFLSPSSSCSSISSSGSSSKRSMASPLSCCVQLALKHCPYLDPYPLASAYLTFLVRNMTALRTVLPGKVLELSPNSYIVKDPDGNCVLVHDVEPAFEPLQNTLSRKSDLRRRCAGRGSTKSRHAQECISGRCPEMHSCACLVSSKGSCCESQDSGRFSDSERGSSELEHCMERLVRQCSLNITDYSESSETDSDQLDLDDSGACLGLTSGYSDSEVSKPTISIGKLSTIQHGRGKTVYL